MVIISLLVNCLLSSTSYVVLTNLDRISCKYFLLIILGWICYAEKTLGSFILPYISSVKSPQQAIGSAIKHHMVQKLGFK
jgi:Iron only hydrogenase large subunit, C-terminal domain